jgi:asparagine synthase (glutamine-hydrolysing)
MCGIAGFLAAPGARPDGALLSSMCDRIRHRGPDDYACYIDDEVALGHRRLSIIDLAGGRQPIGNEDDSFQVMFNGEIYNYLELRRELIDRGHVFRTASDTEVLVHLYEEIGEKLPERLNGMFALAIWDSRNRELFLARDRMGKKPLYYTEPGGDVRFCFASELKALQATPGFAAGVNEESVVDYLALGYVPDPQSIFRGSHKLPPGHSLTVDRRGLRLRRYWEPRFQAEINRRPEETAEELRALAADAVRRRLISDVPLGAFLSGGVDSSGVVGLMAEAAPASVKTFSIGFTSKRFDELPYARMVAGRHRTEHHEQVVTPSIEEMFDVVVNHYDEPFADSSAIPTLYLARMTRRKVTVALSGDGADEVFAGYRLYYYGVLESRLRAALPAWFRHSVLRRAGDWYPYADYLPRPLRAKALLTNLSRDMGEAHFLSRANFAGAGLTRILSPDTRRRLRGYSTAEKIRRHFEDVRELPPLHQMQAVDMKTFLPGDILVKMDRATMAFSLEARAPFLDYRIVELAGRMPWWFKLNGRSGKDIFKRALAPYVPEALLRRPKMGFAVPMDEWMRTSLKPLFERRVLGEPMRRYLDLEEVRRIWGQHQSGLRNHGRRLWSLLMLAAWDERWRERGCPQPEAVARTPLVA